MEGLIGGMDPEAWGHLRRHPWYLEESAYPMAMGAASVGPLANGLMAAMRGAGVEAGMGGGNGKLIEARVIPEGRYNELVGRTRNKAAVLFMHVAQLLDGLLRGMEGGGDGEMLVVADRQGGRSHYGELLRTMFPEWRLAVVRESASEAVYELTRGVRAVVSFREKGETVCLPTALASMVCKYVRELLMARLNGWWGRRVPGLAPTAGYYTDGMRFLGEIAVVRAELGVTDGELVRER